MLGNRPEPPAAPEMRSRVLTGEREPGGAAPFALVGVHQDAQTRPEPGFRRDPRTTLHN